MSVRLAVLLLLLAAPLAAPPTAGAQDTSSRAYQGSYATLSGTVTNAETGAPLAGANVFIAASTMGTSTDIRGRFLLRRIPLGAQHLRVSMVGFEAARYDTLLARPETYRLAVRLTPTVVEAGRLTVSAERDETWAKHLRRFERGFLGTSERAEASEILNPEVLSFDRAWWGRFTAEAARPLVIENDSLGYRLTYFLKAFRKSGGRTRWDGDPLFEPLVPADAAQAARWQAHRRAAYEGSLRHFLRALLLFCARSWPAARAKKAFSSTSSAATTCAPARPSAAAAACAARSASSLPTPTRRSRGFTFATCSKSSTSAKRPIPPSRSRPTCCAGVARARRPPTSN